MRIVREFNASQAGAVAVEFALILPVLALLVAGLLDLGKAINTQARVDMAARAGAQFAVSYPYDVAGITYAVQHATYDNTISLQSTSKYCTCGASNATPQQSSQVCAGVTANPCGGPLYFYVSVTAQQTSTPPDYLALGFLGSTTYTSTATFETASVCPASGQGQEGEQC